MPISPLLRRIASNKHKHIVLKGGAITYHSGARNTQRGMGTVSRHYSGQGLMSMPKMSHLTIGEGFPAPKKFTKTKSYLKPIKFNF